MLIKPVWEFTIGEEPVGRYSCSPAEDPYSVKVVPIVASVERRA